MNISFDLWGTLIEGSPEFLREKIKLTKTIAPDKSDIQIILAFEAVKERNNKLIENFGNQPDHKTLFCELFYELGIESADITVVEGYIRDYEYLFLDYLPLLIKDSYRIVRILSKQGCTLYLSSNTLFIKGVVLQEALMKLDLARYFAGFKFSDRGHYSKPSAEMFRKVDWHVGDNPKTDGACTRYNINFYQINSNGKTILDFYEEVIRSNKNNESELSRL